LAVETVGLKEASKIEIVSLMDNTVDFISSNARKEVKTFRHWTKERYGKERTQTHNLPFAEHGLCMLIRVSDDEKTFTILFDTGISKNGVIFNSERMGIDLNEVSCIVLSHGHYDHFGGLSTIIGATRKIDLPIITHENMFKHRATVSPNGELKKYPDFPKPKELRPAKIINTKKPQLVASNLACVTGEIPRTVAFEKGLTRNKIYDHNDWQPDALILDDRALVVRIKGKGLVVISGCAHAGIINTLKYAQQITGTTKVCAALGGFHLAGRDFENRIEPTTEELRKINPELIAPSHCTGWRALSHIARTLPDAFVFNSVGNSYQFQEA